MGVVPPEYTPEKRCGVLYARVTLRCIAILRCLRSRQKSGAGELAETTEQARILEFMFFRGAGRVSYSSSDWIGCRVQEGD